MKKLIFISLIFLSSFGRAENQCLDLFALDSVVSTARTLTRTYNELGLYEELLNQRDQRLVDSGGFFVANGGLCASTCGVNILHAIYKHLGYEAGFDPINRMRFIIEDARSLFNVDAREGLSLSQLGAALSAQMRSEYRFGVYTEDIAGRFVTPSTFIAKPNTMLMASYSLVEGAHAIVITHIDIEKKEVHFSDPNFPSHTGVMAYTMVEIEGRERMRLDVMEPWKTSGIVLSVLRVGFEK